MNDDAVFHIIQGVSMNCNNLLIGIALMTSAAVVSAAPTTSPSQSLTITLQSIDDSGVLNGDFQHIFGKADSGQSFLDVYTFTIGTSSDLGSSFSSPATVNIKGVHTSDLSFTSFNLYSSGNPAPLLVGTISSGTLPGSPFADNGALNMLLAPGTYSLQIAGSVVGTSGGRYGGEIVVSPVPEPETWGMTVGGLAAVGLLARRRRARPGKLV